MSLSFIQHQDHLQSGNIRFYAHVTMALFTLCLEDLHAINLLFSLLLPIS